jgi:hypothetical protein
MFIWLLRCYGLLMSKKTAKIMIIILNLLAIPAVLFTVYDAIRIYDSVEFNVDIIPFDTGTYYFLLASILWIISALEIIQSKWPAKWFAQRTSQLIAGWFIFCLIFANIIPYHLEKKLTDAGYVSCHNQDEISRVAKGESLIFQKSDCKH